LKGKKGCFNGVLWMARNGRKTPGKEHGEKEKRELYEREKTSIVLRSVQSRVNARVSAIEIEFPNPSEGQNKSRKLFWRLKGRNKANISPLRKLLSARELKRGKT